ncbi:questin oxidase family protein [Aspergillus undulatus]|uniref:questin oxidase family protein n=1 Tax=Aspergillus undulatus TaxID=1810928 RepID=UPI003CCCAFF7
MIGFSFLKNLLPWGKRAVFNLPPCETVEIETAHEKAARTLKHLLKLNHANYAILWNERKFHNHSPHSLSSFFLLGADTNDLNRLYEAELKPLEGWADSPGEISTYDWRDYLGKREYQRAYVDFFEDELVRYSYDWKKVVFKYLFEGKEPLFNALTSDLGHPLIHIAYAFEISSREVAMEALSLASVCYSSTHKYLDDPSYSQAEASYSSFSPIEVISKVRADKRLANLFTAPGDHNIDIVFRDAEATILDHWNAWKIPHNTADAMSSLRESQELATALLTATLDPTKNPDAKYDFFFVHVLTTSHAIRVLLPLIPAQFQIPLVRQWWLLTLAVYIGQLRPEIDLDSVRGFDTEGKSWGYIKDKALHGGHSTETHYIKTLRVLRDTARTWDDPDEFYLKAAVKFADGFTGWGVFV